MKRNTEGSVEIGSAAGSRQNLFQALEDEAVHVLFTWEFEVKLVA